MDMMSEEYELGQTEDEMMVFGGDEEIDELKIQ
jgi:hypothetical protein